MKRSGLSIPLYAVCLHGANALAANVLPVACKPPACGTSTTFVATSPTNAATAVQSGNTLTVHQTSNDVTLNWATFDIGTGDKVVFQQPASTSIALNRIYQSNPSSIFGTLTANGQIYLINANGFLFGSTSTLNVAGMIASSLNITDKTFAAGILSPLLNNTGTSAAALEQFTVNSQNFATDTGAGITNTGVITVQSGAQLTAADGGRLLLAAPTVQNAGTLTAPDGQIVLAAGQRAYLQASSDPSLRGLLVEVDGGSPAASQLASNTVTNQASGLLSAPRGNITLVGLAVNQEGRISATTSVAANGSIVLEAADQAVVSGTNPLSASQGGTLTIGSGSDISILPEYTDTATAVAAQAQLQSTIKMDGEEVLMHGGTITAPSGELAVTAEADPFSGVSSGGSTQARIHIDAGTNINLAGSDAVLPMDANLVTVQLRSNEFADDPTQRNGALQAQTVTVDMRADGGLGTPIADVASAIAAVGQNIAQRTETGGTATFQSTGDVVFNPGASIDVSGGATTYQAGTIQTTTLIGANGKLYNIGSASPLQTYTGLINPTLTQTYDKWGVQEVVPTPGLSQYQSSYQQGAAAGTIQFAAPSMALGGSLQATAVNGPYQRGPIVAPTQANINSGAWVYGDAVPGGTLEIGGSGILVGGTNQSPYDYLAPAIIIVSNPTPVVVADNAILPPQTLQLPAAYLTSDGMTTTQINSNTTFNLPAGLPLKLPAGATLQVTASRLDIDSSITDLAGTLEFQTAFTIADQNPFDPMLAGTPRLGIGVGDNVEFNVSGQWTNDSQAAGGLGIHPTLQNGGSVSLQLTQPGNELSLGNNVSLVANGGAWLQNDNTLVYGKGGSIDLDASPAYAALQIGQSDNLAAFGAGTAAGGNFTLSAPRINISQGNGTSWTAAQLVDDLQSPDNTPGASLDIYAPLFSNYGFSSISLIATGAVQPTAPTDDELTVDAGTSIIAQARSLQLQPGYQTAVSGGTIAAFSKQIIQSPYMRPPTSVSLQVLRQPDDLPLNSTGYGAIDVQRGASIQTDPGATITIQGEGNISIDGTLSAPGGDVTVQLLSPGLYNSVTTFDPGYVANLGITLGSSALIDVSAGAPVMTPNSQGLLLGALLSGGTVNIDAQRGTVLTNAGSMIDFSGASATLDIANTGTAGGYTRETVATPGGSLTIGSVESIDLLGAMTGKAGVGNSGAAAAGSLEINLTRSETINGQPNPGDTMQLNLVGSTAGLSPVLAVDSGTVGVAQIASSGIDSLTLAAGGQTPGDIDIQTGQALSLGRQIVLESQSITVANGVSASLSAPYVSLGNPATASNGSTVPQTLSGGTGNLSVSAEQMNLEGNFALQGIANATLTSQGDVQLQGEPITQGDEETGTLLTTGNLTINAARVYPDTFTNFTINSVDAGTTPTGAPASSGTLTIGQTTPSPGTPLSAGSVLNLNAANVVISGTVLAPFGQINLSAEDSLTLAGGSLVSVSGAGLEVPYGQTQSNGTQWIYLPPSSPPITVTGVPTKQVNLIAPAISVQHSATINLQGGGDLYGYEWVPGTGGSYDMLANAPATGAPGSTNYSPATGSYAGYYAILPADKGQAGPYDPQESGTSIPGQTVYLSAGAGLAAGFYALLPARYALEPGADLIQIQPTYTSANGGQIATLPNGTPIVAGYLSSGTTGLHTSSTVTEYEGFAIYPGSYAQQLAAYTISDASTYFGALATEAGTGPVAEPADAGTLSFIVAQSLNNSFSLEGSVLTAAATGGRGALVNISAPNLEVISGSEVAMSGFLPVSSSVLQSWNASAITLGGTSSESTGATGTPELNVAVAANNVVVDSGVNLTADQILLVAQQSIDVSSGATLSSTSGKAGTVLATLPSIETVTLTNANSAPPQALPQGALLAVSDLGLLEVARSGPVANGATIVLAPNSALNSGGALAVDAPGSITLNGALNGKGASWSLNSDGVAFVGSGPLPAADTDTLNLSPSITADLQKAGAVSITSQGNIDLFTPVLLGATGSSATPTLSSLVLNATALNNQANGNSVFGAATLTLAGENTSGAASPTAGAGSLTLVANTLNLEGNSLVAAGSTASPVLTPLSIDGFANTLIQVAGAVQSPSSVYNYTAGGIIASTSWDTGGLSVGGNLTINAVQLNPGAGSQNSIDSTGTLILGAPTTPAKGTAQTTLVGGALALTGSSIVDNGVIAAPSGVVSLTATGGDLSLGGSASINVAGVLLSAVDQSAPSPGGMVYLNATGNISTAAGSKINVSGSCVGCGSAQAQAAPAGSIDIVSGGTASLLGVLSGAGKGGVGGSFTLDAGALAGGLTPLASILTSGGFTDAIDVRAQSGDLTLNSGSVIDANSITLTADGGSVDIEGSLTATSAAQRGYIDLSAGANVIIGGQLHADGLNNDGIGSDGIGGEIDMNATCATCAITLKSGSVITTQGVAQVDGVAQMGELLLRAPALAATNDVAINLGSQGIGADVSRVGQVIIEPVMVFQEPQGSSDITSDLMNDVSTASAYLTAATSPILARLGTGKTGASVQAGVEIQDPNATDTLSISGLVDLSTYSDPGYYRSGQAPQVIDLSVRAAGSININGTISDGFVTDPNTGLLTLSNTPSASLSLVAGADLSSANPLSVLRNSSANLTLLTSNTPGDGTPDGIGPSVIRTGTGNISLAAAGNVDLQGATSVYTGGDMPANVSSTVEIDDATVSPLLINFGANGGSVTVIAGANVIGTPVGQKFPNVDNGNFSVSGWQLRQGDADYPAQYGINFSAFDWNIGALGGGDVSIRAGQDVTNISAATADSLVAADNTQDGNAVLYGAGGGLSITAGGDIGSAQVFVADGVGTLTAGGGLTAVRTAQNKQPVGSSIGMDDSQVAVWARNSVQIDALYNPTFIPQVEGTVDDINGQYFTYGPDSSVSLSSTAGPVTLDFNLSVGIATLLGGKVIAAPSNAGDNDLLIIPPNLSVQALQNSINIQDTGYLFPSSTGQLSLFAAQDIQTPGGSGGLIMMDTALNLIPTVSAPQNTVSQALGTTSGLLPFQDVIHTGDPDPALITAGQDISDLGLSIPKAADIVAGGDILNLSYKGQNVSANDITLISAGRDLLDDGTVSAGIQVGGPGSLDVFAGRNLNLGVENGIITTGSLLNANLPSPLGANITLMVGYGSQGADLSGFLNTIIAAPSAAAYQTELASYVDEVTGSSGLTFAAAEPIFEHDLSTAQQSALIDDVFFNELLLSGRAANNGSGVGFAQGYAAIDALFPNSRGTTSTASPYSGNLTLTSSQIYTDTGGNISILVPGGDIDVGLAHAPVSIGGSTKSPSQLGIVAEGSGNVNIYSLGDVNVNSSRIFTLGGGNILIWSTLGSIDAGNGSKSSLSVPPPTITVAANGTISVSFAGALATGSGIRTIQTSSDVPPGNVDLDAPVGTVNAGDAGIGASGNINIAAAHVIGVDNINFGGTATGVPATVSNLGVTLSGASAIGSTATSNGDAAVNSQNNAQKDIAPLAQNALSWLDVFVTGLGEENCKPDDLECLKRQPTASP
jgi:filamentous hemagglutinin